MSEKANPESAPKKTWCGVVHHTSFKYLTLVDIGDNGSNRTIIFSFYFILVSYAYYIEVEGDTIELYAFCICSRSVWIQSIW